MTGEVIRARAALTAGVRSFFTGKNYLEVETPLLAPALIPEAAIEVFKTRFEHPYRAGRDLYLTPSPELWMKRLIAGGMGNIFQICKAFRNAEALGRLHNPEFTILEYYTVNADCRDSLELTQELFAHLVKVCEEAPGVFAGAALRERLARLAPPFRRMSMAQAFGQYAGLDLEEFCPREPAAAPEAARRLSARARGLGLPAGEGDAWEEAFNRVFAGVVEPALPRDKPLALTCYPRGVRCLAKDVPGTPWNERWELYACGMEIANCFTEEADAEKIAAYFREEAPLKEKALVPHAIDGDFTSLYAHREKAPGRARDSSGNLFGASQKIAAYGPAAAEGLPRAADAPKSADTSGVAVGLDRLFMAFLGEEAIGGVILFPFSDIIAPHS
ncbi:MAG: hypothetical protein LBQ57_06240 [Spirochaetales bacterium]|nr:hypothetical protein [Spirochaetales bacterium]